MNASKPKAAHLEELTYFNAICCLMVILIHVLSIGIVSVDKRTWQAVSIYIPWLISSMVVPAFLFSGAMKVGAQLRNPDRIPPYGRYVCSRFQKIYLPFVLCNVVYYLVFMYFHYIEGSFSDFFFRLITGTLSSPFYYVLITMQFYLLFPLWRILIQKVPFPCALLSSALITLFSLRLSTALGFVGVNFPYSDRIFTSYLIFWVLGLYVGHSYDRVDRYLTPNKASLLLMGVPYLLYLLISYLQYAGVFYLIDLNNCKLFTDCISIYVLLLLSRRLTRAPSAVRGILRRIHSASFFVYLYHCVFLEVGYAFFLGRGIHQLSLLLPLRAAVCYTAPFMLYFLRNKLFSFLKHK